MPVTNLIYDGTPQNSTTANATPASVATSTTGLWDAAATGAQGQIVDSKGGAWSNSGTGGNFLGSSTVIGGDFANGHALLGSGAAAQDSRVLVNLPASLDTPSFHGIVLRKQSGANDFYLGAWRPSTNQVFIYQVVSGSPSLVAQGTTTAYDSSKAYSVDFAAEGISPTTLTLVVRNETDNAQIGSISGTNSSATIQASGRPGIVTWFSSGTPAGPAKFSRIRAYNSAGGGATSYTMTGPSGGSLNVASSNFTLTPNGAFTGTITPATSGAGTFSPTSLTWAGDSSAKTFTYTPTTTAGSPHSISASDTGSLTDPAPISYAVSSTPPTVGTLSVSASSPSGISLALSAISGGVSPYSTQFHRSTTSGFTPSGGTAIGSAVSGATPTYNDTTASAGVTYYYKAVASDSAAAAATSNQIQGIVGLSPIVLGFVGDSFMSDLQTGQTYRYPELVQHYMQGANGGPRSVTIVNRSAPGTTTGNWLPGGSLTTARNDFVAAGVTDVVVGLGTNNAKTTVATSAASYAADISTIVNYLLAGAGIQRVWIYDPAWIKPNVYPSGTYTDAATNRVDSYRGTSDSLANGTTIRSLGPAVHDYFAFNSSDLLDGVHPNDRGMHVLAAIVASGLRKVYPGESPGTGGVPMIGNSPLIRGLN